MRCRSSFSGFSAALLMPTEAMPPHHLQVKAGDVLQLAGTTTTHTTSIWPTGSPTAQRLLQVREVCAAAAAGPTASSNSSGNSGDSDSNSSDGTDSDSSSSLGGSRGSSSSGVGSSEVSTGARRHSSRLAGQGPLGFHSMPSMPADVNSRKRRREHMGTASLPNQELDSTGTEEGEEESEGEGSPPSARHQARGPQQRPLRVYWLEYPPGSGQLATAFTRTTMSDRRLMFPGGRVAHFAKQLLLPAHAGTCCLPPACGMLQSKCAVFPDYGALQFEGWPQWM